MFTKRNETDAKTTVEQKQAIYTLEQKRAMFNRIVDASDVSKVNLWNFYIAFSKEVPRLSNEGVDYIMNKCESLRKENRWDRILYYALTLRMDIDYDTENQSKQQKMDQVLEYISESSKNMKGHITDSSRRAHEEFNYSLKVSQKIEDPIIVQQITGAFLTGDHVDDEFNQDTFTDTIRELKLDYSGLTSLFAQKQTTMTPLDQLAFNALRYQINVEQQKGQWVDVLKGASILFWDIFNNCDNQVKLEASDVILNALSTAAQKLKAT